MKAVNIEWDTDNENVLDLPNEVAIDVGVSEEDVADYLSDMYGFCIKSLEIEDVIDLGNFSVDVELLSDGTYDVYLARDGSSGLHYKGVSANEIGSHLADFIKCITQTSKEV